MSAEALKVELDLPENGKDILRVILDSVLAPVAKNLGAYKDSCQRQGEKNYQKSNAYDQPRTKYF